MLPQLPLHKDWKDDSFKALLLLTSLTPHTFHVQPCSDCYIYSCSGVSFLTGLSVFIIDNVSLWGFKESIDCIIYYYSETIFKHGHSVAVLF